MNPTPAPIQIESHEEYYVDRILDKKTVDGRDFYLIHWQGYTDADNTWKPLECLTGCDKALREFNESAKPLSWSDPFPFWRGR